MTYLGLRNYNLAPVDWPDGWRGVLGSEPTVESYVGHIVEVFRAVKRVLRDDGTLWLNLGDTRSNGELGGIPWRVALALQADGWTLRADIIWHKTSPMPESVHGTYWQRHRVKAGQNGRGERPRAKRKPLNVPRDFALHLVL